MFFSERERLVQVLKTVFRTRLGVVRLKNLGFIGFSRNRDLSADFYPNSGGTAEIISP